MDDKVKVRVHYNDSVSLMEMEQTEPRKLTVNLHLQLPEEFDGTQTLDLYIRGHLAKESEEPFELISRLFGWAGELVSDDPQKNTNRPVQGKPEEHDDGPVVSGKRPFLPKIEEMTFRDWIFWLVVMTCGIAGAIYSMYLEGRS
ncbi:MAG: hypothetical protein J6I42_08660 [Clostridia bacterium]|nr:hypothetical protein [Clostridia bacterium]MBO5438819.1 hypothetical protein [Thermoguttaceae bacterium]